MVSELKKTGPKIHAQATNLGEQLPKWLDVQMAALEVSMMEGVGGGGEGYEERLNRVRCQFK